MSDCRVIRYTATTITVDHTVTTVTFNHIPATITLDTTFSFYTIVLFRPLVILLNSSSMLYGIKNTFGMLVYSREYTNFHVSCRGFCCIFQAKFQHL
jgi:hypothetical protein